MTSDSRPLTGRLIAVALVFWAAAAGAYGSLRAVYGDRPAYVHVRWAPLVDQGQQESLELRYGLTRGALGEGTTWGYYLTDLSTTGIRVNGEDLTEGVHLLTDGDRISFGPSDVTFLFRSGASGTLVMSLPQITR